MTDDQCGKYYQKKPTRMCRQMLGVVHLYQWGLVRYEIRVTSLSAFQLYGTINKTSPATANMRSKIQLYGTIDKTSPATTNMRSF